ncbi:MAG: carboxypeptidase regulatory-like domain-containing protein [Chryseobacterium sp.]|nr:MAG: carboxypeptidase regulatory-like domain-containing protein [Chryseobacterium sp.]
MNKLLSLFLLIFLIVETVFAQKIESTDILKVSAADLSSTFDEYIQHHPQERVHVHFDKVSYNLGDTVWYKIYIVNSFNHQLSALSGVVHVEIINGDGIIQKKLHPVNAGMANGQLYLSNQMFKEGAYKFNVYTRLMADDPTKNYAFNLNIGKDVKVLPGSSEVANVLFYPEGGTFVAGLRSKFVVSTAGLHGRPLVLSGYIVDDQNKRVAEFNTGKSGMGMFAISPKSGAKYTAIVEQFNVQKHFSLPKVSDSGYVLSVNSIFQDTLLVRVSRSVVSEPEAQLVFYSKGSILNAVAVPISSSNTAIVKVPTASFPVGLNEVLLFSKYNKLLASRSFFLPEVKPSKNSLSLTPNRYASRAQVKINLKITDATGAGVSGGYSIAVAKADGQTGENQNKPTIWSSLILASNTDQFDGRNFLNFDPLSDTGRAELDMKLLSQQSRMSTWQGGLTGNQNLPQLTPEKTLSIGGKVMKTNGEPMAGAKVNLFSAKDMILIDTIADDQGRFLFQNFAILDSADVVIRVINIGAEKNVKIILDDATYPSKNTVDEHIVPDSSGINPTQVKGQDTMISPGRKKEKINELKTVEIAAKRRPVIPGSTYPFAAPPPDYTIEAEELHKIINLTDYLRSRLIGVTVINNKVVSPGGGQLLLLLNGLNIEDLSFVDPRSLTGVQIVRGGLIAQNMANSVHQPHGVDPSELNVYNQHVKNGIIFLTSNHHNPNFNRNPEQTTGIIKKRIMGFSAPKNFSAPDYLNNTNNSIPDRRNTLYWNPNIITGKDGIAEIDFFTSDEKGKYQVTLEGIGVNGQITREVAFFTVE